MKPLRVVGSKYVISRNYFVSFLKLELHFSRLKSYGVPLSTSLLLGSRKKGRRFLVLTQEDRGTKSRPEEVVFPLRLFDPHLRKELHQPLEFKRHWDCLRLGWRVIFSLNGNISSTELVSSWEQDSDHSGAKEMAGRSLWPRSLGKSQAGPEQSLLLSPTLISYMQKIPPFTANIGVCCFAEWKTKTKTKHALNLEGKKVDLWGHFISLSLKNYLIHLFFLLTCLPCWMGPV